MEALLYIQTLFAKEANEELKKAYEHFSDHRQKIQLSPIEGKLLYMITKMNRIKTIVEIGTLAGYSTLWMAQAIPTDGHIYTLEKNKEHATAARKHFSNYSNITLIEGDAKVMLKNIPLNDKVDMVFIDADKGGYCDYLDWADENVKSGGLIVADNTLLFNTVYLDKPRKDVSTNSWRIMREFNQRLSNQDKYDSIIIPTTEGLSVSIKK